MMAEEQSDTNYEHKRLACIVKSVHANLRKKFRANNGDYESVWTQHCQDEAVLLQYAESMQKLATEYWTKKSHTRIDWCRDILIEYFIQGGLRVALEKDVKRQRHKIQREKDLQSCTDSCVPEGDAVSVGKVLPKETQVHADTPAEPEVTATSTSASVLSSQAEYPHVTCDPGAASDPSVRPDPNPLADPDFCHHTEVQLPVEGKIRLLDVGSCYDPFSQFEQFLSVAIDISPANEAVHKCDFLRLEITDPLQTTPDAVDNFLRTLPSAVEQLPGSVFHAVVFSLLLEYLPSPQQRWLCCMKAHQLLQVHGLLVIVTPDSHSQHRNAPMIRSWRTAIESLGFHRWRYVKHEHLHCMAFRKLRHQVPCDVSVTPDMMYIPQDFSDKSLGDDSDESADEKENDFEDREEFFQSSFVELPFSFSDEGD